MSKAREVFFPDEYSLERPLKILGNGITAPPAGLAKETPNHAEPAAEKPPIAIPFVPTPPVMSNPPPVEVRLPLSTPPEKRSLLKKLVGIFGK